MPGQAGQGQNDAPVTFIRTRGTESRSRKLGFYKNTQPVLIRMRANAPQNDREGGHGGKEGGHMREGKSPCDRRKRCCRAGTDPVWGTFVTVREGRIHGSSVKRHLPERLKWPSCRAWVEVFLVWMRKTDPSRGDRQYADEAPRPAKRGPGWGTGRV